MKIVELLAVGAIVAILVSLGSGPVLKAYYAKKYEIPLIFWTYNEKLGMAGMVPEVSGDAARMLDEEMALFTQPR